MIAAQVICDSISPAGIRCASIQVTAHRFILAEINTHRVLSRSYRSSRAVPVAKLLAEVRANPAMPVYWGANEKGMQASAELSSVPDGLDLVMCTEANDTGWSGHEWRESNPLDRAKWQWKQAAKAAADHAEDMMKNGMHKQIANRVLEPFLMVTGIITATEFDNFFGLRLHKAAQPEFRALADAMWPALKASTPKILRPGEWHLPYFDWELDARDWYGVHDSPSELEVNLRAAKISTARCARSSYNSFDSGKRSTEAEDLITYSKLNIPGTEHYDVTQPIHASPAEHQATPDKWWDGSALRTRGLMRSELHGNLVGFCQYRKMLPGEAIAPLPEEYR